MTGQLRAGSKVQHSVQSGLGRDRAAPRTESPPNAFGSKVEKAQRGSHPRLGPLSSPGRLCPRLRGGDAPAQTPALTRDSPPNSWRRSGNPRSQLARAPSPAPAAPSSQPPHVPDTSPDAAVLAHCLPHVKSSEATAASAPPLLRAAVAGGGTAVLGYQSAGHGGLAPESVLHLG